jgi:hypothetical protein
MEVLSKEEFTRRLLRDQKKRREERNRKKDLEINAYLKQRGKKRHHIEGW